MLVKTIKICLTIIDIWKMNGVFIQIEFMFQNYYSV